MCQSISLKFNSKVFSKKEKRLICLKSLAVTWELLPALGMNVTPTRLQGEYIPVYALRIDGSQLVACHLNSLL